SVSSLRELRTSHIATLPTASQDETCCICLNLYGPSHEAVTVLITGCYHRFGRKCLGDYLDSESPRNNSCPQCRREWYKRPPAWTAPREVNLTESLLALTFPQEPALVESRARAHRTRNILEQERASNNGVITSHLDEIFRRLDLIQNISSEQHTSTADTRVRLQAIERRARRLHRELQYAHEGS
ncbi:hypothetical protein BKA58DRAFT_285310, partial [Alternaria rosae]|uniref:uncharacterized protein n=1 Tax=Alternaria rosae TaxID=1187941 RepID=UPI001E8EB0E8